MRSFIPIGPRDTVLVEACPLCADGGLRMAGYLRRGQHLLAVRQCDTCQSVAIGAYYLSGALDARPDFDPDDDSDGPDDEESDDGSSWRRYG